MKGLFYFALGAVIGAAVTSYSERKRIFEASQKLPPPENPAQSKSWGTLVIKLADCYKKGSAYEFNFATGECVPKGRTSL